MESVERGCALTHITTNTDTHMIKTLFIALAAALPLMAQEPAPQPEQGPAAPQPAPCEQKADAHAKCRAEFMEKYDVNKDGKIDAQEKAAIQRDFAKKHPHGPKHHAPKCGCRPCSCAPCSCAAPQGKPCCPPPPAPKCDCAPCSCAAPAPAPKQ